MIMILRAVKANSNSLLSAEENFGIKQDSGHEILDALEFGPDPVIYRMT